MQPPWRAATGGSPPPNASALAQRCFAAALRQALADGDAAALPPDGLLAFARRAEGADWAEAAAGEAAFRGSMAELPPASRR